MLRVAHTETAFTLMLFIWNNETHSSLTRSLCDYQEALSIASLCETTGDATSTKLQGRRHDGPKHKTQTVENAMNKRPGVQRKCPVRVQPESDCRNATRRDTR